jgi:hypothetical protein
MPHIGIPKSRASIFFRVFGFDFFFFSQVRDFAAKFTDCQQKLKKCRVEKVDKNEVDLFFAKPKQSGLQVQEPHATVAGASRSEVARHFTMHVP